MPLRGARKKRLERSRTVEPLLVLQSSRSHPGCQGHADRHPAWGSTRGGFSQAGIPASRSLCRRLRISFRCSCACSIVIPSGPGAPWLDATCRNAFLRLNPRATSSIVIGGSDRPLTGQPLSPRCGVPFVRVPRGFPPPVLRPCCQETPEFSWLTICAIFLILF